jgi:hypothetical protein
LTTIVKTVLLAAIPIASATMADSVIQRYPAVLRQHPRAETQVSHERVDTWEPPLIAKCVHRLGDAAGPNPCRAHGTLPWREHAALGLITGIP